MRSLGCLLFGGRRNSRSWPYGLDGNHRWCWLSFLDGLVGFAVAATEGVLSPTLPSS